MLKKENKTIEGSLGKPILIDFTFRGNSKPKQVVVFCHGFKGFKDWGPFNKIANHFADNDIVFVKFNFSFNGTTTNDPINFGDLKAFGNNNFILNWNIYLIDSQNYHVTCPNPIIGKASNIISSFFILVYC